MRSDRGAAVVLMCAFVVALLAVLGLVGAVGRIAAARVTASTAADLSALAAARNGCERAPPVASANGAALLRCEALGDDVLVEVGVSVEVLVLHRQVRAAARAGPP